MSLGEIDTLNLLTDKLNALFDQSQGYYESFLDANNLYKNGKLTDKQFFQKLGDYVVAYSALVGTNQNPVGAPPSVISAQQGFSQPGTLPTPDPSLISRSTGSGMHCTGCGAELRPHAKFCTKCGNKV